MRKLVKVIIFLSIVLILAGGAFIAVAFAKGEFKNTNGNLVTNVHNVNDEFTNIEINDDVSDYEFVISTDGKCKVECKEKENILHTVEVKDGTLKIGNNDTRKWYEKYFFNWDFSKIMIIVSLPDKEYNNLNINNSTGDINISTLKVNNAKIEVSTGDVKGKLLVKESIYVKSTTGNISLNDLTAKSAKFESSTGYNKISGAKIEGDLNINSTTGELMLNKIEANNIYLISTTGDIVLNDVIAKGNLNMNASTGDISFDSCDANDIKIKTSTGDVEGSLLSDKTFYTKTSTGDVDVPRTSGNVCDIETSTGDIKVTIKK